MCPHLLVEDVTASEVQDSKVVLVYGDEANINPAESGFSRTRGALSGRGGGGICGGWQTTHTLWNERRLPLETKDTQNQGFIPGFFFGWSDHIYSLGPHTPLQLAWAIGKVCSAAALE
jgi:hypothetical protein